MLWGFGRLLIIFFGTLFALFLVVISLRTIGGKQEYSPFTAELRSRPNMTLVWLEDADDINSSDFTKEKSATFVYGLKLRYTDEAGWKIVSKSQFLSQESAVDFLRAHPDFIFYLDIYYPRLKAFDGLLKQLAELPNAKNFILSSPLMDTVKGIRELPATWLTGHSTSEVGRMYLFANLYLEPIMEVPGDVFIMQRPNQRLLEELLRRKIFVFYETDSKSRPDLARTYPELMFSISRPE